MGRAVGCGGSRAGIGLFPWDSWWPRNAGFGMWMWMLLSQDEFLPSGRALAFPGWEKGMWWSWAGFLLWKEPWKSWDGKFRCSGAGLGFLPREEPWRPLDRDILELDWISSLKKVLEAPGRGFGCFGAGLGFVFWEEPWKPLGMWDVDSPELGWVSSLGKNPDSPWILQSWVGCFPWEEPGNSGMWMWMLWSWAGFHPSGRAPTALGYGCSDLGAFPPSKKSPGSSWIWILQSWAEFVPREEPWQPWIFGMWRLEAASEPHPGPRKSGSQG